MRVIIFLFAFIAASYAQSPQTIDVIYLKDGSIIKGKILEIIPDETIKIESAGGNVFVFRMSQIKSVKKERIIKPQNGYSNYNPQKYKTKKNVGRFGWASVAGLTLIGSAAMGDEMFATTVIPVVGPFITMIRIENDPNYDYLPGGKGLLLTSGILQVSFFSYWMYYVIKDSNYKAQYGLNINPNITNIGLTLSYNF